jgi:hypothetical protein
MWEGFLLDSRLSMEVVFAETNSCCSLDNRLCTAETWVLISVEARGDRGVEG